MATQRNLIGKKYGKLTVISLLGKVSEHSSHHYSRVRCECGNEETVRDTLLIYGKKTQCHECCVKNLGRHHMTGTRIHYMWMGMRQRCSNSNHPDYKDYGGRGITVCNEWRDSFETFYEWATTHGYSEDLSIDRIDVNGNYEPDNCRFITMFDQASNKRNNVYIDYESDNVTISEASRRCGLDSGTVGDRIRKGWDEYDATHTEPYKGFGTMVRNRFTNEFWLFDSLAQASEFIGRNRGFLSYLSKKLNRTEFETGDYYVEITKQNIGIP